MRHYIIVFTRSLQLNPKAPLVLKLHKMKQKNVAINFQANAYLSNQFDLCEHGGNVIKFGGYYVLTYFHYEADTSNTILTDPTDIAMLKSEGVCSVVCNFNSPWKEL